MSAAARNENSVHVQLFKQPHTPIGNEKSVAASVVQDTLAAFHCQLDVEDSSVEEVGPRAVEQSSVCTGSV